MTGFEIGVDIVDPKRIEKIYKKYGTKFIKRILSDNEIEKIKSLSGIEFIHKLSGRFAAKEAVAKLLGTGIGAKLSFRDIEITKNPQGQPQVVLIAKGLKLSQNLGLKEIKISISHEHNMVVAFAVGG